MQKPFGLQRLYISTLQKACGTRSRAEAANEAFMKQLRRLSPKEGVADIFIEAFITGFYNRAKAQNSEQANIIAEIDALNKRYQNALLKNADGEWPMMISMK